MVLALEWVEAGYVDVEITDPAGTVWEPERFQRQRTAFASRRSAARWPGQQRVRELP
ncbi:MAG: hypothetical protein PGN34_02850 [Methylobacterium frigidaeris]